MCRTCCPPGEPVAANTEFPLYANRVVAMTVAGSVERHFVLYFNESLRGLVRRGTGHVVRVDGRPRGTSRAEL